MVAWLKHYVFSIEQTGVKREMKLMIRTVMRIRPMIGGLNLLQIHPTVQDKAHRVLSPLRKTTTATSRAPDTRLVMRTP